MSKYWLLRQESLTHILQNVQKKGCCLEALLFQLRLQIALKIQLLPGLTIA